MQPDPEPGSSVPYSNWQILRVWLANSGGSCRSVNFLPLSSKYTVLDRMI